MAEKLFLSLRARTRGCMPLMFDCSLLGVGRWRLHALTNSRYACTVQHLRGKISRRANCWMHVQTLRTDQRSTVRVRVEATICAATEKIRYRTIRQWCDVSRDPFNSYLYGLDSGARFGGSCGGGGLFEYDKAFPKRIPAETKYPTSIEYMYNTVQT